MPLHTPLHRPLFGPLTRDLTEVGSGSRPVTFPLDSFTGPAAVAAWGTRAWTSAAMAGTVTIDDGAGTSTAAYDPTTKFLVGTFTNNRVSAMPAQIGSATLGQTTITARPYLKMSAREGWPVLSWSAVAIPGAKFFAVTSGPVLSGRNVTRVVVYRSDPKSFTTGGDNNFIHMRPHAGFTGGAGNFGNTSSYTGATGVKFGRHWLGTGSWVDMDPLCPNINFTVVVYRYSATTMDVFTDGRKHSIAGAATASNVTMAYVGSLGSASFETYQMEWMGEMIFPTLTDAQVAEITTLIHRSLGGATKTNLQMWMGDSITAGYSTADTNRDIREKSWPYLWLTTAPGKAAITGANMAVAASSMGAATSAGQVNWSVHQATVVDPWLANSGQFTTRELHIAGGSNDIVYGAASAAAIVSKLSTARTQALAAGATRVRVYTLIPRQGLTAPQETMRQDVNTSILSTFGADAVNVAAQNWQPGGAADWSTCYQDGIHPNATGRALFVAALNATP